MYRIIFLMFPLVIYDALYERKILPAQHMFVENSISYYEQRKYFIKIYFYLLNISN